jgi:superfamily II DNA or RNA helicase
MASIDSMIWLNEGESPFSFNDLADRLTVVPRERRTRAKEPDPDTGELEWVTRIEDGGPPVECFRYRLLHGGPREMGLPIDWAMENIPNIADGLADGLARGEAIEVPRLPNPNHPSAPRGQGEFFKQVNEQTRLHYTCMAQAGTGNGKTVTALNAIGHAKRTALAIVPNTGLAHQWKEEAIRHLGFKPTDIGIVGDGFEQWEGFKLVIAVINSVVMKNLDRRFYTNFGFVVWDEAHRLGAQEFSKSMALFPARYKLAMTATPDRKDGMSEVIFNYFGEPAVVAITPPLPVTCWRVRFPIIGNLDWLDRCRNDVRPMKWLSGLEKRNEMLVELINDLYHSGRQIIVLSRFIEHLEHLHDECIKIGIPPEVMGSYTGTWRGKKLGKGYLDKVRDTATIQFATYSKAKEGYDCPRLDAGVEALPVADNVQGIGRVRRQIQGKKKPVWFTIEDLNATLFERYSKARLRGFENNNVTIKTLKGHRLL